jgi:GntR family transcriptional regulator
MDNYSGDQSEMKNGLPESSNFLIYKQISDYIRNKIILLEWSEKYQLPSAMELAEQFHVSRGTVLKAISELIAEGLLVSIRGKGTFVSSTQIEQPLGKSYISFSEDLIQKGIPFSTIVIEKRIENASSLVAGMMSILGTTPVFILRRVRHVNGKPLVYLINYVRMDICPSIMEVDFTTKRLFDVIEEESGHQITGGRRLFSAESADVEIARWLEIPQSDPVFHLLQISYLDDGRPVEVSFDYFNAKKYRLSALLNREKTSEDVSMSNFFSTSL